MPKVKKDHANSAAPTQAALLDAPQDSASQEQATEKPSKGQLLTLPEYKAMSLWQALRTMTEEDWADKMLYINRVQPFTINKTTREKYGSLDKGKFVGYTEDMFRSRFGGGRFHIWLKRGKDTCCEATPQWDGDVKLLVDEELKVPIQQTSTNGQPGEETSKVVKMFLDERRREREEAGDSDSAEVLDSAIELLSKASEKAIDIAAQGKSGGGIAELTAAMKSMHEMISPRDQLSSKDVMEIMLKMADKFTRPTATNPDKPADPVTQLEAMLNVMDRLKERIEPQSAGGKDDWKGQLVTVGLQLVTNLPAIMQQQRQAQMEQFQMMLAARTIQQGPMQPLQGIPGAPAPATPQGAPHSQAAPSAGFPAPSDPLTDLRRNVVRMFKEGDEGHFVARMIQVWNQQFYSVLSQTPKDQIIAFVGQDEILKEMADSPDLDNFVDEMVQYFQDEANPKSAPEPEATVN